MNDAIKDNGLAEALQRADHALGRVERGLAARSHHSQAKQQELRSRVREAVAELDQLIRSAGELSG